MRYLNDILHGMEPTEEFVNYSLVKAAQHDAISPLLMRVPVLVTKTAKLIYQKSSVNKNNVKLTALWLRNQRAVLMFFLSCSRHNIVMVLLDPKVA